MHIPLNPDFIAIIVPPLQNQYFHIKINIKIFVCKLSKHTPNCVIFLNILRENIPPNFSSEHIEGCNQTFTIEKKMHMLFQIMQCKSHTIHVR